MHKRETEGMSATDVHRDLGVSRSEQNRILRLFARTKDVTADVMQQITPRQQETAEADLSLLARIGAKPSLSQGEHSALLLLEDGVTMSAPDVCRAMKRLLVSRQRLQRRHPRGSDYEAGCCWMELMAHWSADQILVGDETAKDRRAYWRTHGYGSLGGLTAETEPALTRGGRTSALTYFSVDGFEDWRFTDNTFDAATFRACTDDMLLTPRRDGTTLASKFRVLLLDRATQHTCDPDWLEKLRLHIEVRFIPAHRHELSPLDNGAYGWVVRFLQTHNVLYAHQDIREGLQAAFSYMPQEAARHCFYNCRYM